MRKVSRVPFDYIGTIRHAWLKIILNLELASPLVVGLLLFLG